MRTTLTLDDDVLSVAKSLARQQRRSLGSVISDLARNGLTNEKTARKTRNGIPLLDRTPKSQPVTTELVNELLANLN